MPTHARTPQPPLLPTPPSETASASAHRRQRTFSSSSSSSSSTSSSSLSTASSAASLPSPSPRGRGGAAASRSTTTATTSVPFSWEHHPGIPKTRFPRADTASPPTAPLPLPPPLRAPPSAARRGRRRHTISPCVSAAADPFAAALAECTRERSSSGSDAGLMDSLFPASPAPPSRRWSIAAAGGGFLDLYGCKNAMVVAEGAFILRRPVAVARPGNGRAGQGRAGRR